MKNLLFCFLFSTIFFLWSNFCFGAQDVVINEIAWMGTNAPVNPANKEWIELYNNTETTIDLTGWKLSATDGTPSINLSGTISSKGYFVLERTDDQTLPEITANQIYTGALGNSGETLEIKNSSSTLIDAVNCLPDPGWFAGDNATKQTMERKNPLVDGSDSTNWANSQNPGGTPGKQNSVFVAASSTPPISSEAPPVSSGGGVPINQPPKANAGNDVIALIGQEISFDGSLSSDPENTPLTYFWNFGDGTTSTEKNPKHTYQYPGTYLVTLTVSDGQNSNTAIIKVAIYSRALIISEFLPHSPEPENKNEWIELVNQSDQTTDISFWQLKNISGQTFVFPAQSFLNPKQYLILPAQTTNLSFNNENDSLSLIYPTGDLCQEIKYVNAAENVSVSLNADNQYVWNQNLTPSSPNIITKPNNLPPKTSGLVKPLSQETIISPQTMTSRVAPETKSSVGPSRQKLTNLLPQPVIAQVMEDAEAAAPDLTAKNSSPPGAASLLNLFQGKYGLLFTALIIFLCSLIVGLGLVTLRKKLKNH